MQVDVITPNGAVLQGEATAVRVPTQMGEMTVLEGHIPVIASLDLGLLDIKVDGESQRFAVDGGFIEIGKTRVSIVTETAIRPADLDVDAEEERLAQVQSKLSDVSSLGPEEIVLANRELKRAMTFLDIAKQG